MQAFSSVIHFHANIRAPPRGIKSRKTFGSGRDMSWNDLFLRRLLDASV
jgi:hypothetical protein